MIQQPLVMCTTDARHNIANSMLNMLSCLFSTLFALHFSFEYSLLVQLDTDSSRTRLSTHSLTHSPSSLSSFIDLLSFRCTFRRMFNISSSLHSLLFLFRLFFFLTLAIRLLYKSKVGMQDNVIYVVHIFMSFAVSFSSSVVRGAGWREEEKYQNEEKLPIYDGMNFLLLCCQWPLSNGTRDPIHCSRDRNF